MTSHSRLWLSVVITLTILLSVNESYAQTKPKHTNKTSDLPKINYKEVKLKNGLKVYLVEDHSAPVISLSVIYDVGSSNEKKGRTGFAHLFEHMMFQGSENVGKNEFSLLITSNGGTRNGTTNKTRTLYFETVPANQLDLILFLEADRMRGLDISTTNLDNQRNVVQEERRLRLDNQAYGHFYEKFDEVIYDNFAFKHSVIGSMDDLNAATVDDVKEFFKIYYAPNNAVLTIAGDFNTKDALAKIEQYFGSIQSQPPPPSINFTEPDQQVERRFTVEDKLAQAPAIAIGYKNTIGNTADAYALQVLSSVLTSGQSSRLYQKLVKEKQLTTSIQSFFPLRKGPIAYQISATANKDKSIDEVETVIYEEIEKIKKESIADWELDKAKEFAKRNAVNSRQTTLDLAINIAEGVVAWNDPNVSNTNLERIFAVTKEDVQRVAQKYLTQSNRTVGIAIPKIKEITQTPKSTDKAKENK